MKRVMAGVMCVVACAAWSSVGAAQGMDRSLKGQYVMVRDWVTTAAAKMPERNYGMKPTPDVRGFGQLIGHIANSAGMICAVPAGSKLGSKAALAFNRALRQHRHLHAAQGDRAALVAAVTRA